MGPARPWRRPPRRRRPRGGPRTQAAAAAARYWRRSRPAGAEGSGPATTNTHCDLVLAQHKQSRHMCLKELARHAHLGQIPYVARQHRLADIAEVRLRTRGIKRRTCAPPTLVNARTHARRHARTHAAMHARTQPCTHAHTHARTLRRAAHASGPPSLSSPTAVMCAPRARRRATTASIESNEATRPAALLI
jgi:hypothetical protein